MAHKDKALSQAFSRSLVVAIAIAALTAMASPAKAACGEFYRVARGDTLQTIAIRQTDARDHRSLFAANRDILQSPSRIETGQLLYLPCSNGPSVERTEALHAAGISPSLRDDRGDKAAARLAEAGVENVSAVTGKQANKVRLLAASHRGPIAAQDLARGGLVPALVVEALLGTDEASEVELAFVEDGAGEIASLLPSGAYDLGAPWPRPNCEAADMGPRSARLCAEYRFSEPVYEVRVVTLVSPESALATARNARALQGARICRPVGFPAVDLEARSDLALQDARDAASCAEMLARGEIDAISLPDADARSLMANPAFTGRLVEARYLGVSVPVHAVALRSDPDSQHLIRRLDDGLARLRSSGRWYELVTEYLQPALRARTSG